MRYNIFISHAWHRSEHYKKVEEWIEDSGLDYANYSVPEEEPLHSGNETKLKEDLTRQLRPTNCVIILGGMYAAHSEWIDYEINEAIRMEKYIIGVSPWGQEKIPRIIQDNANVIVGWNSDSVISAIKSSK